MTFSKKLQIIVHRIYPNCSFAYDPCVLYSPFGSRKAITFPHHKIPKRKILKKKNAFLATRARSFLLWKSCFCIQVYTATGLFSFNISQKNCFVEKTMPLSKKLTSTSISYKTLMKWKHFENLSVYSCWQTQRISSSSQKIYSISFNTLLLLLYARFPLNWMKVNTEYASYVKKLTQFGIAFRITNHV